MSKFEEELAQRGKELENVAVEREWTEKTVKGPDQEKEVILDSLAEETLQGSHDELQRRVEKRTAELLRSQEQLKREIEESKRAVEALRESEQSWRVSFNSLEDVMFIVDRDYTVRKINDKGLELLGRTEEEVIGEKCYRAIRSFDGPCEFCPSRKVLETGKPFSPFDSYEKAFNKYFSIRSSPIFNERGEITGLVDLMRDVTELKQAEQALKESELKYKTLVEQIPAITYIADLDEASTTQFVSPQIGGVLGFKPDEWKDGQDVWLHQLHPDDRERVLAEVAASHASGDPFISEYRMITRDGRVIWIHDKAIILKDEYGNPIHLQGVMFDITERKRAEEALKEYSERLEEMVKERTKELRDAHKQLVRREKLATLGQLAGGLGHELRNPLGAIKNAAYFLNMAMEDPEPEVKEALKIIEKEVGMSEGVISALLDFARPKPPAQVKIDINDVVKAALSRRPVPDNVEVVSQLNEKLPAIPGDPNQLDRVFRNLIRNAIQAMPVGGRLVAKTSASAVEPSEAPGPEWVTVSFTDTGVGIDEETLGKVFEPLFTTKAKGIGLGLALTKMLVEAHGGAIDVESEFGKGTTFTVRLPVKD